jgi:two-component system KDP operon response regulator KdpE
VSKKRVLVVDDEAGILSFVRISLSLAGYEVITTTNGVEGLRLAETARPDIMLLDILMTPVTGFDVLGRLRPSSQLPVIVFTAKSDFGERAMREGANSYITKPFMPEQLVRKIEDILNAD